METLIVESDEAHALAQELAERRGTSLDEAVVASLRASLLQIGTARSLRQRAASLRVPTLQELPPEQLARYDSLRALVREAAAHVVPGATSDHGDMYDDFGLPK